MDGSGYSPRREDPDDHDVETGDKRPFIFLVFLSAAVAASFFYLHRQQALDLVCFMQSGQTCYAAAPQARPPATAPQ